MAPSPRRNADYAHFQAAPGSYWPSPNGYAGLPRKRVALLASDASLRLRHRVLQDYCIRTSEGARRRTLRSRDPARRMDSKIAAGRLLSGIGVGEHEKV